MAGEEGVVGGDAAPGPADGAAAEHRLGGEAREDLHEGVLAQRVDALRASARCRRRRHLCRQSPPPGALVKLYVPCQLHEAVPRIY